MTETMYKAILEVAENGEKYAPWDLNISTRTMNALIRKGYVNNFGYVAMVTRKGWEAVSKI